MSSFDYSGTEVLENLTEAENYNNALKNLVKSNTKDRQRVLDFGAGIGTFTDLLKSSFNKLDCLEVDDKQGHLLEQKGYDVYRDLSQVSDGTYDTIFSLNVFEHIESDKQVFEQLVKKVKPGGSIIIFVPAFNLLYSHFDKFVGHFRRYDKSSLSQLVEDPEIIVKKIKYFDSVGFLAALAFKYIKKEGKLPSKSEIIFYDKFIFPLAKVLDLFFASLFGKNVYCVLEKRKSSY